MGTGKKQQQSAKNSKVNLESGKNFNKCYIVFVVYCFEVSRKYPHCVFKMTMVVAKLLIVNI